MNKPWMRLMTVAMLLSGVAAFGGDSPKGQEGLVMQIKVLPDQAPDCSSLKAIADSVTRGCSNNDAKAIAVYNFMQLTHYHNSSPGEPGGLPALKEINCYGWSLCGSLCAEMSAIWRELGWGWRYLGWSGHTTIEAKYDGGLHYVDVFLRYYAWKPDGKGGRTIAGQDDLKKDPKGLIQDALVLDRGRRCFYAKDNAFVMNGETANWRAVPFLVCEVQPEGYGLGSMMNEVQNFKDCGSPSGWNNLVMDSGGYSADVNLAPGYSLENTWDALPDAWVWNGGKPPVHSCGAAKDIRNDPGIGLVLEPYIDSHPARSYASGTLTFAPDLANDAVVSMFASVENAKHKGTSLVPVETGKPAFVVFSLASPYLISKASGEAAGADAVEVSVDGGKTFTAATWSDLGAGLKGRVSGLVRVRFKNALTSLKVSATIQNNPGALPFLSPGKNQVKVSVADPKALGANTLVVTYAYRLGWRTRSFEQLCDEDKQIARQRNAQWLEDVVTVQKTFSSKDLPATFTIDCPTPKGKYPVYPRMMFVRREVLAPGSSPLPLPAKATDAKTATADELQTLPNPFLAGTETPPVIKPRTVKTLRFPLTYMQYVNAKGEISPKGRLQWPKKEADVGTGEGAAGAVLLAGEIKDLPKRGIAAARLLAQFAKGSTKARCKVGAVLLGAPVEAGKAPDLKELKDVIGLGIVPKQPANSVEFSPAVPVTLDVTSGMKALARGSAKFNGLAIRLVPDLATDGGWAVGCEVASTAPIVVEVDVYVDSL